jgi:UDP-arabinose 4-epimerase
MANILVTGGAGYIGSHTCKALFQAGHTPICYDNLTKGHEWAVKWGPFENGDIADQTRLRDVISRYRPSAVVHFAAFAFAGESVQDPAKYFRNNVAGTISLLDAMRDGGVSIIVFSSSCATYGIQQLNPISEDAPQQPINPYGASKLMVERILADYRHAYGLKSISLRYFNAAGADPEGELGEDHDPETHLIPLVLDTAAGRRPHVVVYGTDYDTPDGTCIRDYIHVSDLAKAHVLATQCVAQQNFRPAYNLGIGRGYSVAEIIECARTVTGRDIPVINGRRREGDPPRLIADSSRASAELFWLPQYSAIADIMKTAWHWTIRSGQTDSSATSTL